LVFGAVALNDIVTEEPGLGPDVLEHTTLEALEPLEELSDEGHVTEENEVIPDDGDVCVISIL
jgi:hypothetical protein